MSYSYKNMCLLPLLADSVIVVDEVHSFDKKMFSALLGFLENFDVPVLCMTASLQEGRRSQLQPWVDRVYDERLSELEAVAHTPRYHVAEIAEQNAEQVVMEAVAKGQRVLWVVNQVNRAQQRAASLLGHSVPVICYHSRFKLADRIERHRETVEAMLPGQPAVAVVATQVCELGLDIDADVLVTESNCPITSLIQRMGRCRRSRKELSTKGTGEVYVYQPEADSVYSLEVQSGVAEFIKLLESKSPVSQQYLEEAMKQLDSGKSDAPSLNSFLRSGGYADGKEDSFRDIEPFNVDSVLNDEVDLYAKASTEKKPGFVVPVPRKLQPGGDSRLPRYMRVGNRTHYHSLTGYHDKPVQ
jgi:CRISPR-associated endonuclease/helicase Cas3